MKKAIAFFIITLLFPVCLPLAKAQTSTPTVNQALLNAIASKTAQLNLVEKRGIIGVVTDSSDTQITLTDLNGNIRFIDVDELTKFNSSSTKSYGISDVTKGAIIGVIGLFNKDSRRILARSVDQIASLPKFIQGAVGSVDRANFQITVVTLQNKKVVIDVTDITKTYSYTANSTDFVKSGFSKITAGQNIIIIGFAETSGSAISAGRIIIFPDIPPAPGINVQEIIPSTGSGMKLTPIVK
jgi:hypothetical protein